VIFLRSDSNRSHQASEHTPKNLCLQWKKKVKIHGVCSYLTQLNNLFQAGGMHSLHCSPCPGNEKLEPFSAVCGTSPFSIFFFYSHQFIDFDRST